MPCLAPQDKNLRFSRVADIRVLFLPIDLIVDIELFQLHVGLYTLVDDRLAATRMYVFPYYAKWSL
jgi:hypothetical protein